MSDIELLRVALVVIGTAAISALAAIFSHGAWIWWYERRAAPRLERGRIALAAIGVRPRVDPADVAVLRALSPRLQVRLFVELAPSLGGAQRRYMSALAREVGITAAAERLCASRRWWLRLRGVRLLTAVGGGETVVPALFADPNPAVRAEAAEWAGQHPTPEVVRRLVGVLATPGTVGSWVVRDSLLRIGPDAVAPLARYLETHGGTLAVPALEVAAGLADARFTGAVLRLCGDALPAVRARAATLAGAIGGAELVGTLEGLLGDPDASVRAAAAAAVGRLGHWPAALRLAGMLRDPAWLVRSQSALAMRRLGSPGVLLLRRALDDEDPFAADIARQVLDMPETATESDQLR